MYGITVSDGFVTLTGEIGTGKTTLCRSLLGKLPDNIDIAIILNPKLDAVELLATICDELGICYTQQNQSLKTLTDLLNQHLLATHANGKRTVLLIDEAQNLSDDVLEQIRLLTNLETTQAKLLQIVLVGQPELREKLNQHKLRQLNQRITARYHLGPLTQTETHKYIQYRLSVSGGNPELITYRARGRIFKLTQGVPRLINILCDRSLLGAYSTGQTVINPGVVSKAACEVLPYAANNFPFQRMLLISIPILISIGTAYYFYTHRAQMGGVDNQVIFPASSAVYKSAADLLSKPEPAVKRGAAGKENIILTSPVKYNSVVDLLSKPDLSMALKTGGQENKQNSFIEFISNPELTMNRALIELLESWAVKSLPGHSPGCNIIEQAGLRCLFDQDSWNNILALNRPVILEFSLDDKVKRYALLVGTDHGQPVFRFREDVVFPLDDVLPYWQGKFLMAWQAPNKEKKNIHPQQSSDDVLWLRKKLAAIDQETAPEKHPRFFDKALEKRVILFQKQHHLAMDGVVGPRTFILLQNQAEIIKYPTLQSAR